MKTDISMGVVINLPDTGPWKRIERIGNAVLLLGDCLEILPTLPKVDAVITDPPYGVNLGLHDAAKEKRPQFLAKQAYENYADTHENLLSIVVPAVKLSLTLANRACIFCAGMNIWDFPRANTIGGVYLPAACGRNGWGFASLAHCLFYGTAPDLQKGAKHTAIRSSEGADDNAHPCPKPIGWMIWATDLVSRRGETVLDPFMGSGTTGVACMNLGRHFIGVEIEEKYYRIACERIENAQRQQRMFP